MSDFLKNCFVSYNVQTAYDELGVQAFGDVL